MLKVYLFFSFYQSGHRHFNGQRGYRQHGRSRDAAEAIPRQEAFRPRVGAAAVQPRPATRCRTLQCYTCE